MPIYEYKCTKCNDIFEKLESIKSEVKVVTCPKCSGEAVRIISDSSYHLKGAGFHNTDYKKERACPSATSGCGSCPHA